MASAVRAVALPASASGTVGFQNTNANLTYMGFSIYGAAACVIRIRANGVITGTILDSVSLAAGESTSDWKDDGLNAGSGLYVELVSGTMPEGSVYEL